MKQIEVKVDFRQNASRLELLIRLPYLLVYSLLLYVIGVIVSVLVFAHALIILIRGKRVNFLFLVYQKFLILRTRFDAYLHLLTDSRPSITGVLRKKSFKQ